MKRALIISAWVLGVLVIAAGAGAAYLLSLVSPANVRAQVERAVESATGRELSIKGDVAVSLWPVFGVSAKDVTLANVPGGRAPSFLDAKEIKIGVAVAPLLNGVIEVHELTFDTPKLALEVSDTGAPNWVFKPKPSTAPAPRSPQPAGPPKLTVHTVRVENGAISLDNFQTGQTLAITAISADSALEGFNTPMTLNASGVFKAEDVRITATVARPGAILDAGKTGLKYVLDSAPLKTSFDGEVALAGGTLKGEAVASGPSLRLLAAWTGVALGEGATLQAFEVKGALSREGERVAFDNATVALDAVKGRGDLLLETAQGRPYVSGRLEIFGLDLNPYLAVGQSAGQAGAVQIAAIDVDAAGWDDTPLDLTGLRAVNANLELTVSGPLVVQNMRIDKLKADVGVIDGVLTVTMSEMELYGGLGAGRLSIDARQAPYAVANELAVDGVGAEQFLEALIGFKQLAAPADVRFSLATSGASQKSFLQNLRGDGSFRFADGALKGVDFGGVSRTIGNLLDGKLIGRSAQTPFRGFNASFKIEKGVAATRDFVLDSNDMRLTAQGSIDIGRQALDLRLTPATVLGRGRDGRVSTGIPIPFVVKGPWSKLEFTADILGGARSRVNQGVCSVFGQSPVAGRAGC